VVFETHHSKCASTCMRQRETGNREAGRQEQMGLERDQI
jgi:hypothetical protein